MNGKFHIGPAPEPPKKPWGYNGGSWGPDLNPQSLAAFKGEVEQWQIATQAWRAERNRILCEAMELLTSNGFPKSRSLRNPRGKWTEIKLANALDQILPAHCPTSTPDLYNEEKWLREAGQRERQAQQAAEHRALATRAVTWLLARGKKYGEDFTADDALQIANQIAFEEEVGRVAREDGFHDFSGQNCEGPCKGWDGKSRRCECGNRRVSWVAGYGHSFEEPFVYGEAY